MVKVYCAKKEDLQTISMFSNRDAIIPNYNCKHERQLLTVLTGPGWFSSVIQGPLLYIFAVPQVRLHGDCNESVSFPANFVSTKTDWKA